MRFEITPHLYAVFLALVFFSSIPVVAAASTHSGEVVYSSGNVWVATVKGTQSIKNGDFVLPGDVLVTGSSGRVKLSMADGSTVYLGSRSRMKIAEYEVRSGNLVSGIFNMLWGKARFLVAKLSLQRSDFSVRTTTAVIGVRGTQFSVQVDPPSLGVTLKPVVKLPASIMKKRMPTNVMLFQGAIVSKNFKGVTKRIKPGQLVRFRPNGAIKIRKIKAADVKRLGLPKLKFPELKKRQEAIQGRIGEKPEAGKSLGLRKNGAVVDKGVQPERRGLRKADGGIVDQGNRLKSDRGIFSQGNGAKGQIDVRGGGIVDQGNRLKSDRGIFSQGNGAKRQMDIQGAGIVDQGNRFSPSARGTKASTPPAFNRPVTTPVGRPARMPDPSSSIRGASITPARSGVFTKPAVMPSRTLQGGVKGTLPSGAIGGSKVSPARVPTSPLPNGSLKLNMNPVGGRSAPVSSMTNSRSMPSAAGSSFSANPKQPLAGGSISTGRLAAPLTTQTPTVNIAPVKVKTLPSTVRTPAPTSLAPIAKPVVVPTVPVTVAPRISPAPAPSTTYRLPMR